MDLKKYAISIIACLQNMLCSGVIFGWSAISETLLVDKIKGPGLEYENIQTIYTMSCMANLCSALPLGILMDWFGPRTCNVVSITLVSLGSLICSISNENNGELCFMIGIISMGFGGTGCQITVMHISNLFPEAKGLVTAIFTGCFNVSYVVFLVFNELWQSTNITYNTMFFTYSLACFVCAVLGGLVFPDKPYEAKSTSLFQPPPKRFPKRSMTTPDTDILNYEAISPPQQRPRARTCDETLHVNLIRKPSSLNLRKLVQQNSLRRRASTEVLALHATQQLKRTTLPFDLKRADLLTQLSSGQYLRLLTFFAMGTLWINFHLGFTGRVLGDQNFLATQELHSALEFFVASNLVIGFLANFAFGVLTDTIGSLLTAAAGFLCALLYCICFLAQQITLLYIGFGLFACYYSFVFVYFFVKIADDLGFRFFGILTGLTSFIAGFAGLLQKFIVDFGSGTCHMDSSSPCFEGNWTLLICIEIALYVAVMMLILLPNAN